MRSYTNRVTAAGAAPDPALSTTPVEAPNFVNAYTLPLVRNITGGAAVAGAVAIGCFWIGGGSTMPDGWWLPCTSVGALWSIFWTIVEFNGEEIGMLRGAYRAGRRSRDAEVNHLHLQLDTFRDVVTASAGGVSTTEANQLIAVKNATLVDARSLLRVIYEHGPKHATREEMRGRKMLQRDWERAKGLCIAAGAVDQLLQPLQVSYVEALKLIEQTHGATVAEMRKSRSYRPAW